MNDDPLHKLLIQADERLGRALEATSDRGDAAFIEAVRSRRSRLVRRRRSIGALAVLMLVGGFSAWSWSAGHWGGLNHIPDTIASNAENHPDKAEPVATTNVPAPTTGGGARRQLRPDEIKRLQVEIAALDAEANRALLLVDLYRAAETRSERLAALEAASAEPALPAAMLAELEIDRAAAITVTSADAQANRFNQPEEAAESYRSVLTHFPSSRWASVARERMAQARHMN
jgi:hypothetical protein